MNTIKVILTRYALTSGPVVVEGEVCVEGKRMFRSGFNYYHGDDWQPTKEKALRDVKSKYLRRKRSLKQQLDVLDLKYEEAIASIQALDFPENVCNCCART